MQILKSLLFGLSILMMPIGALWALQGFGIVHWPAGSFMIGTAEWARNGLIVLGVGLGLFLWTRNR